MHVRLVFNAISATKKCMYVYIIISNAEEILITGYVSGQHTASIPLQQQLEHANQKSGFNEEKYKMQQVQYDMGNVQILIFTSKNFTKCTCMLDNLCGKFHKRGQMYTLFQVKLQVSEKF